jgi:hypothetical protein
MKLPFLGFWPKSDWCRKILTHIASAPANDNLASEGQSFPIRGIKLGAMNCINLALKTLKTEQHKSYQKQFGIFIN